METEVVILKLEQPGWGSLAHGKIFGIAVCFVFFFLNILGTVVFDLRFFSLRVFPDSFLAQEENTEIYIRCGFSGCQEGCSMPRVRNVHPGSSKSY